MRAGGVHACMRAIAHTLQLLPFLLLLLPLPLLTFITPGMAKKQSAETANGQLA